MQSNQENNAMNSSSPSERLGEASGIYLHIPFCKQACYYCDFHFSTSLKRKDEMLQALVKELKLRSNELQNDLVETIYFGGGTPSLLSTSEIELLLNTIYDNYKVVANPEITLEANPDDLSQSKILELAQSPVNRLSIGIQSFFDDDLKSMNRAHNAKEAQKSLEFATQHFDNITIDLIYGIPEMSAEKWRENLQKAFDFGVNHISSYALTVEPNTALESFISKGKYKRINEALALEHFNILVEETAKHDFVHYEISNFGKQGYFSKHNTSYWLGKKYLGIGPSAHSYDTVERSWNVANNAQYIKALMEDRLPKQIEKLTVKDIFNETVMIGLRTIFGVSLQRIEAEFGAEIKSKLLKNAQKHLDDGLLVVENDTLKTTQKGKFLADGLASDLFLI